MFLITLEVLVAVLVFAVVKNLKFCDEDLVPFAVSGYLLCLAIKSTDVLILSNCKGVTF